MPTYDDMIVNHIHDVNPEVEAALRERENQRCCVTGWSEDVKPTYIVSPLILRDSDFQPGVFPISPDLENVF